MNPFGIGIVGGTGGIGRWFAAFFASQGHPVHVAGRKTDLSLRDLAERCRVVIVAVPIGVTREVIQRVGPLLDPDALLMDLTSFKAAPVSDARRVGRGVIGCHPLRAGRRLRDRTSRSARGKRWLPGCATCSKNGAGSSRRRRSAMTEWLVQA